MIFSASPFKIWGQYFSEWYIITLLPIFVNIIRMRITKYSQKHILNCTENLETARILVMSFLDGLNEPERFTSNNSEKQIYYCYFLILFSGADVS